MTRKYPHALSLLPGTTFPTRWLSTNSVHYINCPRCGAEAGFLCVTPSGRRAQGLTGGAHGERMQSFSEHFPELAKLSRIGLVSHVSQTIVKVNP